FLARGGDAVDGGEIRIRDAGVAHRQQTVGRITQEALHQGEVWLLLIEVTHAGEPAGRRKAGPSSPISETAPARTDDQRARHRYAAAQNGSGRLDADPHIGVRQALADAVDHDVAYDRELMHMQVPVDVVRQVPEIGLETVDLPIHLAGDLGLVQ